MPLDKLIDLAIDKHQQGQLSQAEELCKEAIKREPNDYRAYRILGLIAHQFAKPDLAQQLFYRALELEPTNPDIYMELGIALKQGNELDSSKAQKAIELFEMAFKVDPSRAKALILICNLLIDYNNLEEAINIANLAVEVENQNPHTYISRATVYKLMGRLEEAKLDFEFALELDPSSILALINIASINKYTKSGPETTEMIQRLKALSHKDISRNDKASLYFTLSKIYDEIQDYPEAFKYLEQANKLKYNSKLYNPDLTINKVRSSKEKFRFELMQGLKVNTEAYSGYARPIFILGMPRSGSSLIEQILASHPDVYGAGERYFLPQLIESTNKGVESLIESFERLAQLNSDELSALGLKYLQALEKTSPNKHQFICDKLPANFWYTPLICQLFPQAIIIHSVRNPIDTCFSCYQQNFNNGHNYAFDLRHLAAFYNSYQEIMLFWKEFYSDRIYDLSYEALSSNPEQEIRRLLEHCSLAWSDSCLDFHKTVRNVNTASTLQVREAMHQRSVAKWTRYREFLEPLIQGLADAA